MEPHGEKPGPVEEMIEVQVTTVVVEETVFVPRTPVLHLISIVLMERIQSLLTLLVMATVVLTFLLQPFRIPSESMEQTLLVGDFLLVNKELFAPRGIWGWLLPYREPARGERS